ncbi:MAG: SufE family protein [Chlamydiales bacterium]|nr:SufE family protein [Chlamydiales bacterium]
MNETFQSCLTKQSEIKKLFSSCKTAEEKYQKIIEMGRALPSFPEEWKREENLVAGCQSQVFLHVELKENKLFFYASSEALISAGLVALLLAAYHMEPPEAVIGCPPTFLEELGIQTALTPGRSHGLSSILLRMKREAVKFLLTHKS